MITGIVGSVLVAAAAIFALLLLASIRDAVNRLACAYERIADMHAAEIKRQLAGEERRLRDGAEARQLMQEIANTSKEALSNISDPGPGILAILGIDKEPAPRGPKGGAA